MLTACLGPCAMFVVSQPHEQNVVGNICVGGEIRNALYLSHSVIEGFIELVVEINLGIFIVVSTHGCK